MLHGSLSPNQGETPAQGPKGLEDDHHARIAHAFRAYIAASSQQPAAVPAVFALGAYIAASPYNCFFIH